MYTNTIIRRAAMLMTAVIAQWIVRITGPTQVVLGILLWIGRGSPGLLLAHMVVGAAFVLALWVLAGTAARAGLHWGYVLAATAWGILVPVFGMMQARLMPGHAHWIVEMVHLKIGIVAMLIAAWLARFILQRVPVDEGARLQAIRAQHG
jgi:hypothetical protein